VILVQMLGRTIALAHAIQFEINRLFSKLSPIRDMPMRPAQSPFHVPPLGSIGVGLSYDSICGTARLARCSLRRTVQRCGRPRFAVTHIVGVDDHAWRRKNHRYGTIICDLERRRPIRLLPDREPVPGYAWRVRQPQIAPVVRDRSGACALAAARALSYVTQVADRWHLNEDASRAALDTVCASMRPIRAAIDATIVEPVILSAVERLQYEGYLRREETSTAILKRAKSGLAIREIERRTGHGRGDVRAMIRGQRFEASRTRDSSLEPWLGRAGSSPLAFFAHGVRKDLAAIRAVIVSSWSNGQTGGQITTLQLRSRKTRSARSQTDWSDIPSNPKYASEPIFVNRSTTVNLAGRSRVPETRTGTTLLDARASGARIPRTPR
jgi:Transposase